MKIEGGRPNAEASATHRAEGATQESARKDAKDPSPGADRVVLSASAALVGHAIRAAEQAPEISRDLVDRLRTKLETGEVGADAERLAERLIEHLLDS